MTTEFKPITILPLDENQKKTLLNGADSETKLYNFTFQLSGNPPQEWVSALSSAWFQEYHNNIIRVIGGTIVLQSTIENLPTVFSAAKGIITVANETYVEALKRKAEGEAADNKQKDETKKTAQDALKEALNKLNYS